jgi:vanillate O-demethylase ferredoxin subunit
MAGSVMSPNDVMPDFMPVRVLSRRMTTPSIVVLRLGAMDGSPLPPFSAGAHVDVRLAEGLTRPYSLCGDPGDRDSYTLAILLPAASRGGAVAAHALAEGATLHISQPRNNFSLGEGAAQSILIGGGIGITPLLAMAWRLTALGRPFTLHYAVRSEAQAALLPEIMAAPFAPSLRLHVSSGPGGRLRVGRDLPAPDPDTRIYLCGPAGFMAAIGADLEAAGWQPGQITRELFAAEAAETGGETFTVSLASTSARYVVGPDETIAQVLTRHGVELALSCEQGMCGTCLVGVLEGVPEHRDAYQTAREKAANTMIALCCSRARTAHLLLDL